MKVCRKIILEPHKLCIWEKLMDCHHMAVTLSALANYRICNVYVNVDQVEVVGWRKIHYLDINGIKVTFLFYQNL